MKIAIYNAWSEIGHNDLRMLSKYIASKINKEHDIFFYDVERDTIISKGF
jgi:hypothetical protein